MFSIQAHNCIHICPYFCCHIFIGCWIEEPKISIWGKGLNSGESQNGVLGNEVNSFQNDKNIDSSKWKAFANNISNGTQNLKICFGKGKKHRGKQRKCWLPAFSPFPTMFSRGSFLRAVKSRDCMLKGYGKEPVRKSPTWSTTWVSKCCIRVLLQNFTECLYIRFIASVLVPGIRVHVHQGKAKVIVWKYDDENPFQCFANFLRTQCRNW